MTDEFAIWPSAGNLIFLSLPSPSANGSDTHSYVPALLQGKTTVWVHLGTWKQNTNVMVGPLAGNGFCWSKGCKNQVKIKTKTSVWTENTCGSQGPKYFILWSWQKHSPPAPLEGWLLLSCVQCGRQHPWRPVHCVVQNTGIHPYTEIIDDTSTGNKGLCL